ncbi:hypothetical protein HDU90_005997 [Geranomyces variabilis]|nr:hypothetical protein HDU90_005997 [Geranomyces variabilis]
MLSYPLASPELISFFFAFATLVIDTVAIPAPERVPGSLAPLRRVVVLFVLFVRGNRPVANGLTYLGGKLGVVTAFLLKLLVVAEAVKFFAAFDDAAVEDDALRPVTLREFIDGGLLLPADPPPAVGDLIYIMLLA